MCSQLVEMFQFADDPFLQLLAVEGVERVGSNLLESTMTSWLSLDFQNLLVMECLDDRFDVSVLATLSMQTQRTQL